MSLLRVALDVPLPRLFDYLWDPQEGPVAVGQRVVVPFGNGRKVGIVLELPAATDIPAGKLRRAERVLDDLPPLPPDWLELARFCAEYYQRPLGEGIHAALPPRFRRPEPLVLPPNHYRLTGPGREALQNPPRSAAQKALLQQLAPGPAALPASPARRELLRKGWIAESEPPPAVLRFIEEYSLTPAQNQARQAIEAAFGRFQPFLLLGVTGSGKTEVYLHLVAEAVRRGLQALVLVPEINLTPQLEQQFRQRLQGATLVTLNSALAENERAAHWLAAQRGQAQVVLGTRLAVFTPLPRLGLVVVDEEHDASFKQQDGVRYSARDLAVYRASRAGAPVVLGSATPSLESYAHAESGRYTLLELPERAREGARLPDVRLLDLRSEPAQDGLCAALEAAVHARLARGEQSLIFLNRRGYAPVLACPACGWASGCPRCTAHLVVHLAERRLRCHHCGYVAPVPRHCPQCGNVDIMPFGRGTQRLEELLARRFPEARVLRIDSDSTRNKGSWEKLRARIAAGDADILVGTQILAKGHDFPRLTLVGVLNADAALLAADYRAPERLFAQLYQVAGRAGRADRPGEVLVQTRYPHHPLYAALVRHDYKGFAAALLREREQAGFPPYVFEAVLRAESRDMNESIAFLQRALGCAPPRPEAVIVFDPVPMSLPRLGGWERAHLLLQSRSRRALQNFLREWSQALYNLKAGAVRWHIEVDPLEF